MKKFFTFTSVTRYLIIPIFFGCFILFSFSVRSQRSAAFQDENLDRVTDAYDNHSLYMPQDASFSVKDTGDIVHSIPTPGTYCQGLAWDGSSLWCSQILFAQIYQLNPVTGTVMNSFSAPGGYVEGLAWDGNYLWAVDNDGGPYETNVVYKLDPINGTVLNSFGVDAVWIHGLAWDGQYLWMIDFDSHHIHKVDPETGDFLHTIDAPGEKCVGLTWDGNRLWTDDYDTDKLYCIDPIDGEVIYEVDAPHTNPRDLACDGEYIWVMAAESSTIYQVDVGGITAIEERGFSEGTLSILSVVPNPFSVQTTIAYTLDRAADIKICLYNASGQFVTTLEDSNRVPGDYQTTLDGFDIPDGLYYCVIQSAHEQHIKKIIKH